MFSYHLRFGQRGEHPPEAATVVLQQQLFVGSLTSQQHASVSLGWICSDNFTCCHTEIEAADQTAAAAAAAAVLVVVAALAVEAVLSASPP